MQIYSFLTDPQLSTIFIDRLTELWFYFPFDTKLVTSETFLPFFLAILLAQQ